MKKYLVSFFLTTIFPLTVSAESILGKMKKIGGDSYDTSKAEADDTLVGFAGTIISVFLGLLGVIFLVIVISAGYTWMMAGGDSNKITEAKNKLWRAIIGLLIVVGAYAIQAYVFGKLVYSN